MDNATFLTSQNMLSALKTCTLFYLPPYSPDLNPIEHK
ncbi:transposase [Holospora obtusa]